MHHKLFAMLCVAAAARTARADVPPPASLAWGLRAVAPATVVRADTTTGVFDDAGATGETVVTVFSLSWKLTSQLAPLVRSAIADDHPAMGPAAVAAGNPLLGVIWAPPILAPPWTLSGFAAITVPIGSGGGDDGDPARAATARAAMAARAAMDNALFAVNDAAPIAGIDVAYVRERLTVLACRS